LPGGEKRLIESERIYTVDLRPVTAEKWRRKLGAGRPLSLLDLVNAHSEAEKQGGGRPEYWEMVFWWTRKPLAGARFVVAASLLPENVDVKTLAKALGYTGEKLAHRVNPQLDALGGHAERLREASLLDPFAGFGSIPLEAARLGLREVAAVELLPTAYIFLKAVLEYPATLGGLKEAVSGEEARQLQGLLDFKDLQRRGLARPQPGGGYEAPALIVDLARAGKRVLEELKKDPDIAELYDPDVAVYIGSWEVKCPHNGKYTPLIGNWWLARVRSQKGRGYARLAYMKPTLRDGEVEIEVVDLNKIYGSTEKAEVQGNKIKIAGETHQVPEPNITPRSNTATCLHDGKPLGYIDPETGKHYPVKQQAPPQARERLEWLPKWALKQWNKMLEDYLNGKITLEQLKQAPARPRILVKVKTANGDIEFHPATPQDQEKLWKALEKLKQSWPDPDIPTEPIPDYETRSIWVIVYGFNKWFKLFNPRQLLTLTKLTKLIRQTGKRIEKEKLEQGWSQEEARKHAEAITTYLTLALLRKVLFNSLGTTWNAGSWALIKIRGGGTLSFRGISMNWNWSEINTFDSPMYSWEDNVNVQLSSLAYLYSAFSVGSVSDGVSVVLGDATMLSLDGGFSVVVTDPPYYDDVPYSELSDFYYVWLKRALSDVEGGRLVPRFHGEAFFRRVGGRWREVRTQWEEYARREISVNTGRLGGGARKEKDVAVRLFEERLGRAFERVSRLLAGEGLLVTYYNHTDVDAWRSLLRAGWEIAGLRVSAALPLATESAQRVTARGKVRLDTSIVVVWRRGVDGGRCEEREVYRRAVEEASRFVGALVASGRVGYDIIFAGLGRALSVLTSCREIVAPRGRLGVGEVAELAYRAAVAAVAEALTGGGGGVATAPGRFYMVSRILFAEAGEIRLDGATLGQLQVSIGASIAQLRQLKIVEQAAGNSGNGYRLLHPGKADLASLKRLLAVRGLGEDPERAALRSSVDALHILYLHAYKGSLPGAAAALEARAPNLYREALAIARALCNYLPQGDPEKALACRVAKAARGGTMDSWLKGVGEVGTLG